MCALPFDKNVALVEGAIEIEVASLTCADVQAAFGRMLGLSDHDHRPTAHHDWSAQGKPDGGVGVR